MRDYTKTWVQWIEPFSKHTGSDAVYLRIRGDTAIKQMRAVHAYKSDEDAFMDFVVVNWAEIITEEKQ
jgi:hypothetical protein